MNIKNYFGNKFDLVSVSSIRLLCFLVNLLDKFWHNLINVRSKTTNVPKPKQNDEKKKALTVLSLSEIAPILIKIFKNIKI
jgi:hypothetical protein